MSEPDKTEQEEQHGPVPDYDKEPVPRLPRAKFGFLSTMSLFRIAMLGTLLVAVLVMRKPCADGVAKFIGGFEDKKDGGAAPAPKRTPLPPGDYVRLDGPLTEEKLKALRERAARRARDAGVAAAAGDANTLPKAPAPTKPPAPTKKPTPTK